MYANIYAWAEDSVEPSEIASIVKKIANSDLSVDEYFREHAVPFGRAQYFRYKARLAAGGLDGLADGRGKGNHRKLTADVEGVHSRTSPW